MKFDVPGLTPILIVVSPLVPIARLILTVK